MAQAQKTQQGGNKPKTAITPTREDNFPEWYQAVIKAADFAENSPVRGCMTFKPYGYALWENIQRAMDDRIKDAGVQNAYFPLLIPVSYLSKEAEHVEGFAKECAIVTHHRLEKGPKGGLVPAAAAELEEPFVIRPTSETIIGEAMSRWVQSYRDLPLKLNQWCNIMRWEMRTRMFLRTAEFLWQEGHNAFATADEAEADARLMLEMYRDVYENVLAISTIPGEKTPDERFPGADRTYTLELMMQDGKALQGCTSHNLGQNFSKSLSIVYQGEDGQQHHAHTTSWGFTSRSIGATIMTHADDDGMIMPPNAAPNQVAIIPVIRDDSAKGVVFEYCKNLAQKLKAQGIRAQVDMSDARTPDKMWACIKKGVPVRVEIGQREIDEAQLTYIRRDLGKDSKKTVSTDEFLASIAIVLRDMQLDMLAKSRAFTDGNVHDIKDIKSAHDFFASDTLGFVKMDASMLKDPALDAVRKEFSVTPRCLPFADEGRKVILGRSY